MEHMAQHVLQDEFQWDLGDSSLSGENVDRLRECYHGAGRLAQDDILTGAGGSSA